MEKKNLIFGAIGAVVLIVGLIGMKMYKDGQLTAGTENTAPAQVQQSGTPSAPVDPYASYSAPAQQ